MGFGCKWMIKNVNKHKANIDWLVLPFHIWLVALRFSLRYS